MIRPSLLTRRSLPAALSWICAALAVWTLPALAQEPGIGGSRSVFGTNPYMSDGATALMLGNYEKGVELSRMGLKEILSTEERATLLSNLCAGYVGLKEFDTAIVYCNRSLDLDPNNWRALQNRAAAYSGIGQVNKAVNDAERGLELNPGSDSLKLTLSLIREQAKRDRKAATSPAS
jgi:tetratricopeptide (TPR) repeat protein